MGHVPVRLTPNLGARGLIMGPRVSLVTILVEHVEVRPVAELFRLGDGALRGAGRGTKRVLQLNDVRTEEAEHGTLLEGDG